MHEHVTDGRAIRVAMGRMQAAVLRGQPPHAVDELGRMRHGARRARGKSAKIPTGTTANATQRVDAVRHAVSSGASGSHARSSIETLHAMSTPTTNAPPTITAN